LIKLFYICGVKEALH